MSSLIEVLENSFFVLKREPRLFAPKIFLALLWGAFLLFYTVFLKKVFLETNLLSKAIKPYLVQELFSGLIFLLVLFFVFFIIDSVINASYSLMIQSYLNKKNFSVLNSIKTVLDNFWKVVIPIIFSFILMLIALVPFAAVFVFFLFQKNFLFSVVTALITFIVAIILSVVFYFIYPVASIEKKGLVSVINSVKKAKKNLKEASFGTIIFSVISVISAFIVSFAETELVSIIALILFILLRVATAVLATYSMVLNPLLYFKK